MVSKLLLTLFKNLILGACVTMLGLSLSFLSVRELVESKLAPHGLINLDQNYNTAGLNHSYLVEPILNYILFLTVFIAVGATILDYIFGAISKHLNK